MTILQGNDFFIDIKNSILNNKKNLQDIMSRFESLPPLFKEIEKDSPKIVKKHIVSGFKTELNKLYSDLKKIQESILSISQSFDESIPSQHRFDIFNKTTDKNEYGLYAPSKESIKKIYEMTGDTIEVIREYNEFGNLIWSNPNSDIVKKSIDDNMKDLNNNDSYTIHKEYISNIDIKKLAKCMNMSKSERQKRQKRAKKIHDDFKKQYPKAFEPNCSIEDRQKMLEEFRQKRHQKEAKKLTKRNSKKVTKK